MDENIGLKRKWVVDRVSICYLLIDNINQRVLKMYAQKCNTGRAVFILFTD